MKKLKLKIILILLVLNSIALCQWSDDPYVNTRVSYWGVSPKAAEDGSGGAFVTFNNFSYDSSFIFLQVLNFDGTLRWLNPIRISDAGQIQGTIGIIPSDSDEVIIGYNAGTRSFDSNLVQIILLDPYVQKLNGAGGKLWNEEGVRLRKDTTKFFMGAFDITYDNSGGVFCFWEFHIIGGGSYTSKLYIQHISKDGERLWGDNGILVADSTFSAYGMKILSDDNGGIYLQYHQNQSEYYIENYDSTGTLKWRIIENLEYAKWIKDGQGGIVLSAVSQEYPVNKLILNRISHSGEKLWGENGIVLDDSVFNIIPRPAMLCLNTDSTITVFWDNYGYPYSDIFIQRYNIIGDKLWDYNLKASNVISQKTAIGLLESEMNTNILVWADGRVPSGLYAQRIDKFGIKVWGDTDRAITNLSPGTNAIISDGNNGAIAVWADDEPLNGILAQQISKNGNLGEVVTSINDDNYININPNSFRLFQNYPNPFNPSTVINFSIKEAGLVKLKVYDILGSEVAELVNETKSAGNYSIEFDASNLPSGMYIYKLQADDFVEVKKMILTK